MAELVSPGVSISVSDESFYASAGTGTVPLIVIATAQDKASPDGAGVAPGTTADEAGKLRLITSQRDLLTTYGNPVFQTSGSTPLNGHELNEYGLLAAQSFLGIANRAYVLRANIDLSELEASTSAPTGDIAEGSYWARFGSCTIGVKRWDGSDWVRVSRMLLAEGSNVENGSSIKPKSSYGKDGDFAILPLQNGSPGEVNEERLYEKVSGEWYHVGTSDWLTATSGDFQVARHTNLPINRSTGTSLVEGDLVWQMNEPNGGNSWCLNIYEDGQWVRLDSEGYAYSYQAYDFFEAQGGPESGDLWKDFDPEIATFKIKRHNGATTTRATATAAPSTISAPGSNTGVVAFEIVANNRDVVNGNSGIIGVTFEGFDADEDGNLSVDEILTAITSAISSANATLTESNQIEAFATTAGTISIIHNGGRDIELRSDDVDILDLGFTDPDNSAVARSTPYSNWVDQPYLGSFTEPTGDLADGALWYDSRVGSDSIDLLWNDPSSGWVSYPFDVNVAASTPQAQSDGSSTLVENDIWIDSSDLENYPQVYRWTGSAWALLDNSDQESDAGIVFADVRSSTNSLDSDAPNPALFPFYMIVWNKRLSGGNVKQWNATEEYWEDYSGNKPDGSPYMLRKAQRRAVVRQLQSAISTNQEIRNESNGFNLISIPGYPELLDEMIALNTDRKETAFIIADAPLRLSADASSLQNWATNGSNAIENGEDGLVSSSPYAAVYYPHGLTTNLDGNNVVVPASHIALRTFAFNDQVAFPWFAPAGFQRGVVTNATSVGYIDAQSGEFQSVALSEGQRDSLYINKVNPVAQFPGRGLSIFGQKTLNPVSSALDRVNVARLVVFIRERLDDLVKPFLFEPNDEVTRQNAKVLVDRFLGNLVTQRGLFDFVVVCDSSNNTPERIDRNELHIDIAIQPVKAVEFIYIPIRVQNTLGQTN